MLALQNEIAKKLYLISNGLAENYYGISSNCLKIEKILIDYYKCQWTPKGWKGKNVSFSNTGLEYLPLFSKITGKFEIYYEKIKSLKNSPQEVREFSCEHNDNLKSLHGGPHTVRQNFTCNIAGLGSLEGGPVNVGGIYSCTHCDLITLKGAPKKIWKNFVCSNNKLKNLIGAPEWIKGTLDCSSNKLESLVGAPSYIGGNLFCIDNYLTIEDLEELPDHIRSKVVHNMEQVFEFFRGE